MADIAETDRLERAMHRAEAAKQLLADPLLNEGFETLISQIWTIIVSSREDEIALRERAYGTIWAAFKFRDVFKGIVQGGADAKTTLETLKHEHMSDEDRWKAAQEIRPQPGAPL